MATTGRVDRPEIRALRQAVDAARNSLKRVKVTIEQSLPGNLSAQDWQVMREIVEAVKLAVPDASFKPPGEVLEYVRARLASD
jgi:hypothetical protein